MPSARSRPASRSTASTRSGAKSFSMCRSPMRRSWPWIRCRGAGISAACPGRATCRSSSTSARCSSIGYDGVLSLEIFNDRFARIDGRRRARWHALARLPARAGGAASARSAHRLQGNRVHRILRQRGRGGATRPDVAHAGFRRDPPARSQGRHALAPGRHQPRRQLRARWIRALLRHRAWSFGVRDRFARRRSGCGAAPREPAAGARAFRSPWGPASTRFRRCAASAAACSTS